MYTEAWISSVNDPDHAGGAGRGCTDMTDYWDQEEARTYGGFAVFLELYSG